MQKGAIFRIIIVLSVIVTTAWVVPIKSESPQKTKPKWVINEIRQSFLSASSSRLDPFFANGKRVFSNWKDMFNSIGFFGKSQVMLSLAKFFREYTIIKTTVSLIEMKKSTEGKARFRLALKYSKKNLKKPILKDLYLLLVKQPQAANPRNPAGWVIIEIKTIN